MENKQDKLFIECDCHTHILQVVNDIEYIKHEDKVVAKIQTMHLAMFNYGVDFHKESIWNRIKFSLKYIKTGIMFSDQLSLNPSEAKKLSDFLVEHIKD